METAHRRRSTFLLVLSGACVLLLVGAVCKLLWHHGHSETPLEHVSDSYFISIHGVAALTKFMLLELLAGGLVLLIFIPLARRLRDGTLARGLWQNFWEMLLVFVRDEVAVLAIGPEQADKFVPFLWTEFLFILFCNLLGLIPFLGSPTASMWATGGLALCSFVAIYAAGIGHMGLLRFLRVTIWPPMEIPAMFGFGWAIKLMIALIEVVGLWMKSSVLAIRLFANMLAGHIVLVVILGFTVIAADYGLAVWTTISFTSVLAAIGLSLLELFVACLQAYVFVFLTALFIGMSMHPH
jgi:F-type H+-transporting ATPase subunit a